MPTKLEIVQAEEAAAFVGDWEKFKTYFTRDIHYRVGNTTEVRGIESVIAYLQNMLSTTLAINDLQIRTAWETDDTVVLELNMAGLRLRDNKNVSYPCVDIYHFDGDRISDWQVYAIEPTFVV